MEESVPALAGQAAADPTRREDLEALLHEFERRQPPPGALTFDTSRLRSLLGCPAHSGRRDSQIGAHPASGGIGK